MSHTKCGACKDTYSDNSVLVLVDAGGHSGMFVVVCTVLVGVVNMVFVTHQLLLTLMCVLHIPPRHNMLTSFMGANKSAPVTKGMKPRPLPTSPPKSDCHSPIMGTTTCAQHLNVVNTTQYKVACHMFVCVCYVHIKREHVQTA